MKRKFKTALPMAVLATTTTLMLAIAPRRAEASFLPGIGDLGLGELFDDAVGGTLDGLGDSVNDALGSAVGIDLGDVVGGDLIGSITDELGGALGDTVSGVMNDLISGITGSMLGEFQETMQGLIGWAESGIAGALDGLFGLTNGDSALGLPDRQQLSDLIKLREIGEESDPGHVLATGLENGLEFGIDRDRVAVAERHAALGVAEQSALSPEAQERISARALSAQMTAAQAMQAVTVSSNLTDASSALSDASSGLSANVEGMANQSRDLASDSEGADVTQHIMRNVSAQLGHAATQQQEISYQTETLTAQVGVNGAHLHALTEQAARDIQVQEMLVAEALQARVDRAQGNVLASQVAESMNAVETRERREASAAAIMAARYSSMISLPGSGGAIVIDEDDSDD